MSINNSRNIIIIQVKYLLLSIDKLNIHKSTIESIADLMEENNIPVDLTGLYLNCIVDGLVELLKYNMQFTESYLDSLRRKRLNNSSGLCIEYKYKRGVLNV